MKDMWKKISPYAVSIAIALAVGGLSAALTNGKMEEYAKLNQPPLAAEATCTSGAGTTIRRCR